MNDYQLQPKEALQSIKLIEGTFTPSEANDILTSIVDKKINFHKIQRLKIFEGNHNDPCVHDSDRLNELIASKERLVEIVREVKSQGRKLKIHSNIHIEIVD